MDGEDFTIQETAVMEPEMGSSSPVGIEAFVAREQGGIPQFKTARGYEMYIQMRNQTLQRINQQTQIELRDGVQGLLLDAVRKASPEAALEAAPWITKPGWVNNPESIEAVKNIVKQDAIQRKAREDEILEMRKRPSLDINPLSRSVERYMGVLKDPNTSPEELKLYQDLLRSFALKNNSNVTFDEKGNPSLQPGLSTALRTKLEAGMNASGQAMSILDSLTDDKIESAFGAGAALRDIGQSLGGANVGMGHTKDMTDVFMALETVKPMVRTGIQDEKGAVTEGDVARASALLADFRKNSPEQAKQKIKLVKEIFRKAQERQGAALQKAPSVQKQERDAAAAQAAAPAAATNAPPSFNTPQEAEAAKDIPVGSIVIIGGKKYRKTK